MLFFAEQARIVERFGRQAEVDLLALAAQVAQEAAAPLDLAGLIRARPGGESGGLVLLMPETAPHEAAVRLSAVSSALATTPFTVRDERVHVTPVTGWVSSIDNTSGADPALLAERACAAAANAETHLDLVPMRWTPALDQTGPRRPKSEMVDWLRTPTQFLLTMVLLIRPVTPSTSERRSSSSSPWRRPTRLAYALRVPRAVWPVWHWTGSHSDGLSDIAMYAASGGSHWWRNSGSGVLEVRYGQ